MSHVNESAGRILTKAVPCVAEDATAAQVERLLRDQSEDFETINYLYVVSKEQILKGVLSVRELFRLPNQAKIGDFMQKKIISVRPHTDQERVAQVALKHNLKAVPVVTKEGEFLGVVSSDTILSVLNQEHTEDVLRFAGVRHKHTKTAPGELLLSGSPFMHVRLRLPWLVLGLVGGVAAAVVVGWFESTLAEQLILAAFIPAIVYMADAVGSQTQMLFIRALSVDETLSVGKYLKRELIVNFLLGLVLSVLAFCLSFVWLQSILVSSILGISIFLTVWFTVIVAIALPWFFSRAGQDPAVASGPLATVVRDIVSLCIYLLVATTLLAL